MLAQSVRANLFERSLAGEKLRACRFEGNGTVVRLRCPPKASTGIWQAVGMVRVANWYEQEKLLLAGWRMGSVVLNNRQIGKIASSRNPSGFGW